MDLRLYCDRTLCVAGPSHSGKTTFVLRLLEHRHEVFHCTPNRVIWCYGIYQPDLNAYLAQKEYITHNDIIPVSDIQPYDIVVLDDLIHESKNSQDVTSMFTRAAHHKPCFIIFIMQNLFPPGKESRTRSLNTHYYCLYKNPRDKSQVEFLARQILPRNPKALINVFEAATEKPHSYLFLDLTQECPEQYRFRSNLFEKPIIIYQVSR
ncbi:MAG: hypothetical protein AAFN63_16915 [Pseudomonadota bacterium]